MGENRLDQLPKLTLTNFDGRNSGPTFRLFSLALLVLKIARTKFVSVSFGN
jgi:hypothetical protein